MMKISDRSLESMRERITPLDTEENRTKYLNGEFPRADKVKDLDKRYRWDLAHAAGVAVTALYDEGLNDTHIDTALRNIVPPLEKAA